MKNGEKWTCNYIKDINYNEILLNVVYYTESDKKYPYIFITSLSVTTKNQLALAEYTRRRWKIENEGFDIQKHHGYYLEHMFSKDYTAIKNHYYLVQIGHMISQILENWKKLWGKIRISLEEKHKRLLFSWKFEKIKQRLHELAKPFQVRLQ